MQRLRPLLLCLALFTVACDSPRAQKSKASPFQPEPERTFSGELEKGLAIPAPLTTSSTKIPDGTVADSVLVEAFTAQFGVTDDSPLWEGKPITELRHRLGAPSSIKPYFGHEIWFYSSKIVSACGSSDFETMIHQFLVKADKVVKAVSERRPNVTNEIIYD